MTSQAGSTQRGSSFKSSAKRKPRDLSLGISRPAPIYRTRRVIFQTRVFIFIAVIYNEQPETTVP